MKARVRVYSFTDPRNEGSHSDIGVFTLNVERFTETLTKRAGLCSLELVKEEVTVTTINGRTFILDKPKPFCDAKRDFDLCLPHSMTNELKFCSHCGEII